ncbi:hypothetical protein Ddye_026749, partial [Dipteronia dyeriana]
GLAKWAGSSEPGLDQHDAPDFMIWQQGESRPPPFTAKGGLSLSTTNRGRRYLPRHNSPLHGRRGWISLEISISATRQMVRFSPPLFFLLFLFFYLFFYLISHKHLSQR